MWLYSSVFDVHPFFDDKRSLTPVVLGGFLHVGEVGLGRQPADALGVEQAGLDRGENLVGIPAFAGGHRRIDRLRLDAARVAVLGELAADWRVGAIVIERGEGGFIDALHIASTRTAGQCNG